MLNARLNKAIEDEAYFFPHCTAYNTLELRHGFSHKNPKELMNTNNHITLSIYLHKSFELRKETFEQP